MPTESYYVTQVYSYPVKTGITRYEICLQARAANVADTIVTTLNALRASVCERAKAIHKPVSVGWRETRFGGELITVTLLAAEDIADSKPAAYLGDPIFAEERK